MKTEIPRRLRRLFGKIWRQLRSILLVLFRWVVLPLGGLVGVWYVLSLWNLADSDGNYYLRAPLITAGVAAVAAIFLFWRNWIAERQLQEERYKTGVELLGHTSQVIRIGGLYALHQLAEGFPRTWALPVLELMCIFVRTPPRDEEKDKKTSDENKAEETEKKQLRRDVQEAVQLLGIRSHGRREIEKREQEKAEKERRGNSPGRGELDFRGAGLAGGSWVYVDLEGAYFFEVTLTGAYFFEVTLTEANFAGAKLAGVNFSRAKLGEAYFSWTTLTGANFSGAMLDGAIFHLARLEGANFSQADITDAIFDEATLTGANLVGADITGAYLENANLSGVILLDSRRSVKGGKQFNYIRGSTREQLEEGWIEEGRPPMKIEEGRDEHEWRTTTTLTEADWKELGLDAPPTFKVKKPR